MAKTPVCETCLITGELCAGCLGKKERQEISEADVKTAKALHKHATELGSENAGFEKAVEFPSFFLVFSLTPAALIGRRGKMVSLLNSELGKKIKVINPSAEKHEQLTELLLPAKLAGLNEVFAANGKEYRVRIPREDASKLPADLNSLKKAVELVLGQKASIALE